MGALTGKYTCFWSPSFPCYSCPTNIPTGLWFRIDRLSVPQGAFPARPHWEMARPQKCSRQFGAGQRRSTSRSTAGAGALFGWLDFGSSPNEVYGVLYWIKPGSAGGTRYPQGFTNALFTTGSRYVAPPSGTPALTLTMGEVILNGGNLIAPITDAVTLAGDNKISGDHQLADDHISGTERFIHGKLCRSPLRPRSALVKGVILRGQNIGGGQFLGTDQTGRVFIGDP